MRKTFLLLAAITLAAAASAQITPTSLNTMRKNALPEYETASAHNYSTIGMPLVKLTASRKDTLNFVNAAYSLGAVFTVICTASANDSTLILPASGTINGASSYWFTGTYKHGSFWYDGTNFWLK